MKKAPFPGRLPSARAVSNLLTAVLFSWMKSGNSQPTCRSSFCAFFRNVSSSALAGEKTIEADIRLVAATNKDLAEAVKDGTFRDDLYYRLNVIQVQVPPLRERREDIPLLAMHFLSKFGEENEREYKGFTPDCIDYLTAYEWPGNVRQLENVVERCSVLAEGDQVAVRDLPPELKDEETQYKSAVDLLPDTINLPETLEKIEAALVRRALARTNFVQVKAADLLGISKSLLQYKLKKYKITGH